MAIFVYAENIGGLYKKSTLEAVAYAKAIADKAGEEVVAITINPSEGSEKLYAYGASKVISIKNEGLKSFSAKAYSQVLTELVDGKCVVFPHTPNASSIAPMFAIKKDYSLITNVLDVPNQVFPFEVRRKVFSGKGFMTAKADKDGVVITVYQNAFGAKENPVSGSEEVKEINISNDDVVLVSHEPTSGKLDLKEAEIVVSAGRGLKGPENWGMVEDLADVLGAALASSKPVADIGWRPHSEHVGQTGKAIAPNLYIAIGISGAIQHLAGVNGSKTILVINNDPEAPFFKSADYGVVGDAFQVVPALVEKIKALKG